MVFLTKSKSRRSLLIKQKSYVRLKWRSRCHLWIMFDEGKKICQNSRRCTVNVVALETLPRKTLLDMWRFRSKNDVLIKTAQENDVRRYPERDEVDSRANNDTDDDTNHRVLCWSWVKLFFTPQRVKADTHEGFCSRSMLQGHAPGAKLLRVYQRFHGYTSSSGAEFPPRKMLHDI